MSINAFCGKLALTGGPVWIWIDQIVSMSVNREGGAVIRTIDGQTIALKEKPDEVIATIDNMLKGIVQT